MKIPPKISVHIMLPALFFLLTACTFITISTQPTPSTTVTPGSGIALPPQSATQPSSTPTATPRTQQPTPTHTVPNPTSTSTNSGTNVTPLSVAQAAQSVLTLIDQERAGAHLPALIMNNALIRSAHKHNLAMLAAGQLAHQLPGEADLGTRITAQGITWNMAAENIGYGFGDATQTALSLNTSMFAEKPPDDGHRRNILSGNTLVGVDVIVNPQNAQVWLTEDFARPA